MFLIYKMLKTTNLKNISKTAWNSVSINVKCQGLCWTLDRTTKKIRELPQHNSNDNFHAVCKTLMERKRVTYLKTAFD